MRKTRTSYNIDESVKPYAKCKKPFTKEGILNNIYLKCPEQANPQKQIVDCCLALESGGVGEAKGLG